MKLWAKFSTDANQNRGEMYADLFKAGLPKKTLLKKWNLFSLAYFPRRKKAASQITPGEKEDKKQKQIGLLMVFPATPVQTGTSGWTGRTPRNNRMSKSLSGTKDICWGKQELTGDKDKARQHPMAPQSAPARCQGQRQRTRPMSQEESIMLNNSVSSICSKSAQMRLKWALQTEIWLRPVMSGVLAGWENGFSSSVHAVWIRMSVICLFLET